MDAIQIDVSIPDKSEGTDSPKIRKEKPRIRNTLRCTWKKWFCVDRADKGNLITLARGLDPREIISLKKKLKKIKIVKKNTKIALLNSNQILIARN